jgi:hypothetical protein
MSGMNTNPFPRKDKESFLTNMVIKYKLAKDYRSAQKLLVFAAIVFFALSIYFFLQ